MLDGEGEGRKAEADGIEDCPKRKLAVQWLTGLGKKACGQTISTTVAVSEKAVGNGENSGEAYLSFIYMSYHGRRVSYEFLRKATAGSYEFCVGPEAIQNSREAR